MNKRSEKTTELKKSEYVKDKEEKAAQEAEIERRRTQKEAKKNSKKPLKEKLKSQKFRHGTTASAITALGLVILVLVNVVVSALGSKFPSMNIDMTTGNVNSLSDSVKAVVDGVKQNTTLTIIGTEEQVKNNQLLSSSVKYSQVGIIAGKMAERNNKISVAYMDLDKNPTFASKYSEDNLAKGDVVVTAPKNSYVVKSTDLFNVSSDSQTGTQQIYTQVGDALASGISNANSENTPVIAFETGHSEQLSSDAVTALKKLYTSNQFTNKDFSLLTDKIPDNAQLVFIGAPKTDYTDAEIKKLDEFLASTSSTKDRGLVLTTHIIDPEKMPKLAAFLKEWGITLANQVVMESDASKYVMQQPSYLLAQAGTDVTLNKSSSYSNLLTPLAQAMTLSSSVSGVTASALLKSNDTCYTVSPTENTDSSAANKTKAASVIAAIGEKTVGKAKASVAVCGSSVFFTDGIINTNTYSNGTWTADLAKYMTGTTSTGAVTITPVQTNTADISLSSAASSMVGLLIFTIVLPLCCFGIGIVVYRRRRKL